MKKFIIAALGVALAGIGVNAYAADNVSITPSLQITTSCTVSSSGSAGFSAVAYSASAGSAQTGGTVTLTVACPGTAYWLGASTGDNYSAGSRYLKGGQTSVGIAYTLALGGDGVLGNFGNAGATPAFSAPLTTGGSLAFNQTTPAASHSYTVIATTEAIPAGTLGGTYTDTVVITAAF